MNSCLHVKQYQAEKHHQKKKKKSPSKSACISELCIVMKLLLGIHSKHSIYFI